MNLTFCAQVLQALDAGQGNQNNAAEKLWNMLPKDDWKIYKSLRKPDSITRTKGIFKQVNMFYVTWSWPWKVGSSER